MKPGERIGELAREKGMSLRQLALHAGIPYSTLYAMVRRKSGRIEPGALQRIASALGVHILDLVGIGEELDKLEIKITDVKPLAGAREDVTPEKIAELRAVVASGPREIYDQLSEEGKAAFWDRMAQPLQEELAAVIGALDDRGREKVLDYARDLLPVYRRQEEPQADG